MDSVIPGSDVIIDRAKGNTQQLTLRQDASARAKGCYTGQEIVTIICQPSDGPLTILSFHSFHGVLQVSKHMDTCTVQSFRWIADAAYAIAPGAVNER